MTQSTLSPQLFRPYAIDSGTFLIAPEGLLCHELTVGVGEAQMHLQDPPEGHVAVFAQDDIVRIRAHGFTQNTQQGDSAATIAHDFWAVGDIPSTMLLDIWLQVGAVTDLDTHFQYKVTSLSPVSAEQYSFAVNTLIVGYGPADNRLIQLRATRASTPQVDVLTTGNEPWLNSETNVRLGRLDDLGAIDGEQYGLAAGANLNAANSMYVRVSEQGIHLNRADLTLNNGSVNTMQLDSSGAFTLANTGIPTIQINNIGDVRFGSNLELAHGVLFDLQAQSGTLSITATTMLHGNVIYLGDNVSYGALRFQSGEIVKAQIDPVGGLKLGPDVSSIDGVDLAYDAATRCVHIRNAQLSDSELIGSTKIADAIADKITMAPGYTPNDDQDMARWGDVKTRLQYDPRDIVYQASHYVGNSSSSGQWVRLARTTFHTASYNAIHLHGKVLERKYNSLSSDEILCRFRMLKDKPGTPTIHAQAFPGDEALFSELRAIHISGENRGAVFELWGQYRLNWARAYIEWKYVSNPSAVTVDLLDAETEDGQVDPPIAASRGYDLISDY